MTGAVMNAEQPATVVQELRPVPPPPPAQAADVEQSPVVLRDVFPADVTTADGNGARNVRAVITTERLYVWHELNGAPALLFQAAVDPLASDIGNTWSRPPFLVAFVDGGEARITAGSGCGCGSPLRSARLFDGVSRVGS
jgi:hypothetical protein